MSARVVAGAALIAAALGCRPVRPTPAPGGLGDVAASDAGTANAGSADAGSADAGSADAGSANGNPAGASATALSRRAEEAWARRDDPLALDETIRLWEEAALHGEGMGALVSAARARRARGEASLARSSLSSVDPSASADALAAAARDYEACSADARRAWSSLSPAAAQAADAGRSSEAFRLVPAAGAEAIYLDAVCASAWSRTQGFTQLVERRGEIQEALRRAAELSPALDDAGPERELGRLLASLPAYAGGDLREARLHLETAIARAPLAPRNHLLYAKAVAVKLQDRTLFEAQLNAALEPKPLTPEDRAAVAESRDLLQREDELFGPAQAAQPTPGGPAR